MSSTLSTPTTTSTSTSTYFVFDIGNHVTVAAEPGLAPSPKPLLIVPPAKPGSTPCLSSSTVTSSTTTSRRLPRLRHRRPSDSTEEINSAAELTNWLSEGLQPVLTPHVKPNLSKLAVSGHSRGRKAAFALALGKCSSPLLRFSALRGVDPVDGMDKGKQTPPAILTYVPQSFDIGIPTMVVGSGLGEERRNPWFAACAPGGSTTRTSSASAVHRHTTFLRRTTGTSTCWTMTPTGSEGRSRIACARTGLGGSRCGGSSEESWWRS